MNMSTWVLGNLRLCIRNLQTTTQPILETLAVLGLLVASPAIAAVRLNGQVLGAGAPIANSTVTLWAATSGPPARLGRARTGADGRFSLNATTEGAKDASLYLVARGGKSAANKTTGDNSA